MESRAARDAQAAGVQDIRHRARRRALLARNGLVGFLQADRRRRFRVPLGADELATPLNVPTPAPSAPLTAPRRKGPSASQPRPSARGGPLQRIPARPF